MLDKTDPFHPAVRSYFQQAMDEKWTLQTTDYVVHETWALVQKRLGWAAVEVFLDDVLPRCQIEFVDAGLYELGALRCRQARQRNLSLTDCISLEYMKRLAITTAIARDEHFTREQIVLP